MPGFQANSFIYIKVLSLHHMRTNGRLSAIRAPRAEKTTREKIEKIDSTKNRVIYFIYAALVDSMHLFFSV